MNKKKIKKISSPPKNLTNDAYNYTAAVIEEMNSNFQAFGEVLGSVRDKVDGLEVRFDGLEKRFDGLEVRFDGLEGRFDNLEGRFDGLENKVDATFEQVGILTQKVSKIELSIEDIKPEIFHIKTEIEELRHTLSKKADVERLNKIETKVEQIIKHFKLSFT